VRRKNYDYLAARAILEPEPEEEAGRGTPKARPRQRRRRRQADTDDWFSPVPLWWLSDERFRKIYSARARIHARLWFETYNGTEPVTVTNELAAELGLSKQNKMRELWTYPGFVER